MKYKLLKDLPWAKAWDIITIEQHCTHVYIWINHYSRDELIEYKWWFEPIQEEHKTTKAMREWKELNQWEFEDWNEFWKEFYKELNKQIEIKWEWPNEHCRYCKKSLRANTWDKYCSMNCKINDWF